MSFKSLLLDIDGVVVRDKLLMAHVQKNCVNYVQTKLPECKNPSQTNKVLYLTSGHTARGLTRHFGVDTRDFNAKVYDKNVMDHLYSFMETQKFKQDVEIIHEMSRSGWNVTLFTNSPVEWARPIAMAINDEVRICCPDRNLMVAHIKPDAKAFENFPKNHTHVFVDDSLKNLGTARRLPNWHPIHFYEGTVDYKPWCPTIGSMWELNIFLNTADHLMKS